MIDDDKAGFALTATQKSVVTSPWDARILVTAGAGAGKTTMLAHRLEHLTDVEELTAGEILVLSFSRAAVRELRGRVDRIHGGARRVRAQTFDGWAYQLLRQADPNRDRLANTTFDRRVTLATQAIDGGVVESTEHGVPAHVIIDEVQDLVGPRREMVEALLDRFADACGFTVVGDAAQSIYGFQVSERSERAGETNRFLDWVRASFADDLMEVVLDRNFRARTPEARLALPYGARLRDLPADRERADRAAATVLAELRSLLDQADDFGELDTPFVRESLLRFDGTTAILCRDNAQVLILAERLNGLGVPHDIQRSPGARVAPAWLAGLLLATEAESLTEDRFTEILPSLCPPLDGDPKAVWRALRRAAGGARGRLDLTALAKAVADGRLPDELTAPSAHGLVLSTVHRAKGLEFDRVLIVEPEPLPGRPGHDEDHAAEARLLYVAMTRPRDDVYRLGRPDTRSMRKGNRGHLPVDRWYVGGFERWRRFGVEAGEHDVSHAAPAGVREPLADPIATQRHLAKSVRQGDAVELRRLHDLPMSPTETPPYGIFHGDHPIGEVSARFRGDLWRLLKQGSGHTVDRWPYRITGLRIDGVETVVGLPSITERQGMGHRGVWLSPRLCGLGRFDWTHSQNVPEGHLAP